MVYRRTVCCFSHSACYWLPNRESYFTRWPINPARGLLNREKIIKEKVSTAARTEEIKN